MGGISKAQAELSGGGYDSDERVFSLRELSRREEVLVELLKNTRLAVEGTLNPVLTTRVDELSRVVTANINTVVYSLVSSGGISLEEYEGFKGLAPNLQTEKILDILSKLSE